jgi:hypothetical protein
MPLTERQFPWTGTYGVVGTQTEKHKGNTAEALKRTLSRLGYLDWGDFDNHYNMKLDQAMEKWQRKVGISPASGSYGQRSWVLLRAARVPPGRPNSGEYAIDFYSRTIVQAEARVFAESKKQEDVQEAIAEWCRKAIANEPRIHYSQVRPVKLPIDPSSQFSSDCSGTIIQAYYHAKQKTDLDVVDPSKWDFRGYGNTDWYMDDHRKVGAPYRIGDIAHFHSPRHVILCIKAGDVKTAEWFSHGTESGPDLIRLASYSRFPGEFMFVVRPPLLEEDI